MAGPARAGQETEPTYPPEGTWLAFGTMGDVTIPYMDTYASLHNQHGSKGTVICTLDMRVPIPLPLGPEGEAINVSGTTTGQGNWVRVEKNVYAFTVWRMLLGPNGNVVGWAKFLGSITTDAPGHFLGEISVTFYTWDFVVLPAPPMSATTEGWRVAVEVQ